jgi:spore coat protein CotF
MNQYQNVGQSHEIKRPEQGQAQSRGPEFTERDRIQDMLSTEKYLSWAFDTSTFESGPRQLHDTRSQVLSEIHNQQRRVFEEMFNRGWYPLKSAKLPEIQKVSKQFAQYRRQLPYGSGQGGQLPTPGGPFGGGQAGQMQAPGGPYQGGPIR